MLKINKYFVTLIAMNMINIPMSVYAQEESQQPTEMVLNLSEDESVVIEILSTLPPKNALYVNDEENLTAYLFDEDKLFLLYKNEESAQEWSTSPIANIGRVDGFDYSRLSKQFLNELNRKNYNFDAVVELSPVIYYFADMPVRGQFEVEEETIGYEYQGKVILAKDNNGNDIDLRLGTDDSWDEFVDFNGNLYQSYKN